MKQNSEYFWRGMAILVICLVMAGISAVAQTKKVSPGFHPQPSPAQNPSAGAGMIVLLGYEGQLVSCENKPMVDVDVFLTNQGNGTTYTAQTDKRGVFRFHGIQPGTYKIHFSQIQFSAYCLAPDGALVYNKFRGILMSP